jgi:cell division protein ZapA
MNEDKLTIQLNIADRYYPVTISQSEEGLIRASAKEINDLLNKLSIKYPNKDTQDYMAMALLQFSHQLIETQKKFNPSIFEKKLEQLNKILEDFLVQEQVL